MLLLEPALRAILNATHGDPFAVLGPHLDGERGVRFRTFQPRASAVRVLAGGAHPTAHAMAVRHPDGIFEVTIPGTDVHLPYQLEITGRDDGEVRVVDDPYRFGLLLGELDVYLIGEGRHQQLHRALGAHPMTVDGTSGTRFAVWAPNARRVSVVGDWNRWDGRSHPMRQRLPQGVWELFVPGVGAGGGCRSEAGQAVGRYPRPAHRA